MAFTYDINTVFGDTHAPVATDYSVDAVGGVIFMSGGAYNSSVINKAWHTPTAQWIRWYTDLPDPGGEDYPGPGSYGDCVGHRIENVTYSPV
jgi:hypothetical protein